jgi:TDG/mug DNA glycosylase family protein
LAEAERFTADLSATVGLPEGAVVDLGCGPGWHLGALPSGTIAVDGAAAMLDLVPGHLPGAPRIRADLRALPLRRGSLRAVWANKSHVHLQRSLVPLALWDLHRCLAVGGLVHLGLFGGDQEHAGFEGDPFSGRSFSLWPEGLLADVLEGAGLDVEWIERPERDAHRGEVPFLSVRARRLRTLADTVGPGMRLLLVGLNPSLHAADRGVGFTGPGNRGWPALEAAGLATTPRDPVGLLLHGRVGMTDLVKRATARASEVRRSEFRAGLARLERLVRWLEPAAVCIVGLTGWRAATGSAAAAGAQEQPLGGRPVWVMPNPSGLNAVVGLEELAAHLRGAAALADRAGRGGAGDAALPDA